uniref:Down syndrome critical region protein 3 n=1 Tax=Aceria tosichella TaxID=561515 RepID=A0A6G1S8D3_9ACAR
MPLHTITIELDRPRNVYQQGEYISGKLILDNKYELKHDGILLSLEGFVDISASLKSVNLLSAFSGSTRSIPLVDFTHELTKPGRLYPGETVIPFKMLIDGCVDAATLHETYHGVYISIQYFIKCRIKRPIFFKDLVEAREFIIEFDSDPIGAPPAIKQLIKFEITPDSLSAPRRELIPDFRVTGQLDSLVWQLNEPITGEFQVEHCSVPIRSIELQLVRVETFGSPPPSSVPLDVSSSGLHDDRESSRDATEVQNIQIVDGNPLRNMPISIHMVLPKLFTCPTVITAAFRIEFEINLVIIFNDNYVVTENFPIKLIRSTLQPISLT